MHDQLPACRSSIAGGFVHAGGMFRKGGENIPSSGSLLNGLEIVSVL